MSNIKPTGGPGGDFAKKSEQAKKSELLKEIHQVKIKIQAIEKEKATHVYNKSSDFCQEFAELQEIDKTLSVELKAERVKVAQQINKIKGMVKQFHREVHNVKPTPEFLEKVKGIMEEIEKKISEFKEKQREKFEELLKEERLTGQEIIALERRMETWSQAPAVIPAKPKTPAGPLNYHRDITKDLPPEVAAFEKFEIQNGGPRGGWDEYDHGTFLKFWNRNKGKGSLLEDCVRYIPTKTEQEINQHIAWYKEYLSLKDKKKVAIQKWKEKKEVEKEEVLEKAVEEEKEQEDGKKKIEEMKKEMLRQEAQQRRQQLNAWRVEKELQKAEEKERILREQARKAQEKQKEKMKKMELKDKVEEYREIRRRHEEEERQHQQLMEQMEREMRKPDPVIMAKMHQRDMEKVQKKQEQEKEKALAEREKQRRLSQLKSQVEVKVNRDPTRLYQLTEGWKERNKHQGPSGDGPILHMQHKGIPTWRQGLS